MGMERYLVKVVMGIRCGGLVRRRMVMESMVVMVIGEHLPL